MSAGLLTANEVLDRSLRAILDEDADFKVIASLGRLAALNEGLGGFSQVGKFVTIYPNDDAQAVRLAEALHGATEGLAGPRIPSDRALRRCSVVQYRYGGFGGLQMRTALGEFVPALRAPDGSIVPDLRLGWYDPPPWAKDPFVAAGIANELPPSSRRIGDRYVILARLHWSPRSQVYLCVDLSGPRTCVVKRVTDDGSGSLHRLRNEHRILSRLAPDSRFPQPIELFGGDGELCLAMEDLQGESLQAVISSCRERSVLPSRDRLVRWTADLAEALEAIHAEGLVYGDLKASNVMVGPDGKLRLVDFEIARDRETEPAFARWRGTPGYMSPQQLAGRPAAVADDVFGLGALMYLIATGAEPSFAPNPSALLDRPVELLNPALGERPASEIGRCLDPDPDRRPVSPRAAAAAVAGAVRADLVVPTAEPATRAQSLALARRIGDALCEGVSERGFAWPHGGCFDGEIPLDLNMGVAGAILALAELVTRFDDPSHRAALAMGARWLAMTPRPVEIRLPGLYVGEAGIGVALLRAGRVLQDDGLTGAAAEVGRWIASVPHGSPDLFNGTAGRLRFHLWLWLDTGDDEHVEHATAAAEYLLSVAREQADGLCWTIPPGYGRLSGQTLTGYAHGAAGIGDVLLDLFELSGREELRTAAQDAGRWLKSLAEPALQDGSGVNWSHDGHARATMAFWCHGAAGITRFLARLGQLSEDAGALELARRGALVVATGTRWSGVSQCHGLAGNVECLLDMYQTTTEESYLVDAMSMARLMHAFAVEHDERFRLTTGRGSSNPGFSTGCAGVAACLLRLTDPHTRPHLLSLRSFNGTNVGRSDARHDSVAT